MAKKKQPHNLNELLHGKDDDEAGCMSSLRGKALSFLGKDAQHLCDDAISDALFKAFKTFPKFVPDKKFATPEDAFSAWIGEILRNACLDKIRTPNKPKEKPRKGRKKRELTELTAKHRPKTSPEIESDIAIERWLNGDFTNAVHDLTDDYEGIDPDEIPSIEDNLRWHEELESDMASIYIEDEPGGCMALYVRGEDIGLKRFTWEGPHEPPDITLLKLLARGTPRKTIAKRLGKSVATIDKAISRMKKKMLV